MGEYLARLNPEQRAAVEAMDGPVLVLAGAGTGKTRVLTTRFAHILLTGRAAPGQVLAVTFTNKAAREMRDRVGGILGRPAEGLWLGTFHALCARMLRRHAPIVGLTSGFTILDSDDQLRVLKQVMEAAHVDQKRWAQWRVQAAIVCAGDAAVANERTTAAILDNGVGPSIIKINNGVELGGFSSGRSGATSARVGEWRSVRTVAASPLS